MNQWLVQQCQRRVWLDVHGDPAERTPGSRALTDSMRDAAIVALSDITVSGDEPPIWLASHCDVCAWQAHCQNRALETRALTLLPRLNRATWQQMHDAGLRTMHDIVDVEPAQLRRFHKVGDKTAKNFQLAARAFIEGQAVWRQPLEQHHRVPGLWLDIETEWDIGKPWSWGWQDPSGALSMLVLGKGTGSFELANGITIQLVQHVHDAWAIIAESAGGAPIYHWGGYDQAVMRATAPANLRDHLDPLMIDFNGVVRRTVVLPLPNTSLKTVAPYVGSPYPDSTDAFEAWQLYINWQRRNDFVGLAKACGYLRADVVGLARTWEWMTQNSPD